MADNPNPNPGPTPFPIKIIHDPPPSADGGSERAPGPPPGRRCDDFYPAWEKFICKEPKRAKKITRAARELEEEKRELERSPDEGLRIEENAATSWEQAVEECRAKVAAIVSECKRLNQKYRDAIFDLEASPWCLRSLTGKVPEAVERNSPPWIKRVEDIFDKPQFFIDGPTASDVHQGSAADCWFLAALMAVTAKKELIERLCVARDEKVGVYGFVFYRDGEWIYEVIDDKLYLRVGDDDDLAVIRDWDREKKGGTFVRSDEEKLKLTLQKGGIALYFSHCKSNETWLPLIEKAYAKAHGDYYAIEGGFPSEGIEDLTGGVGVVLNPEDIMDKDQFWNEQLSQVNEKYLFGGGSKDAASKGFVASHAYAVLQAWEEGDLRLLKLRNPWGRVEWQGDWSDGSKLWTAEMMIKLNHTFGDDGVFWISYHDFLKHFPSINRVRLFSAEWSVAQQWTCVNVPWTVDYLDTKFQFSIDKPGPVVIVLCQPDDRYFYGLDGRYIYSMHFRVYKEGETAERWIVRSMHNSGAETLFTRSVSAEIEDLEPGTYNVVFKVTALRSIESQTAEEAVMKYAVERKEKLLHVGRRYDYAQTKGNLKAMEEANRKRAKQEERLARKKIWKRSREVNRHERERERRLKKRINDAMRERRKAFEFKQRERSRARREKVAARERGNASIDPRSGAQDGQKDIPPFAEEKAGENNDMKSPGPIIDGKPTQAEHGTMLSELNAKPPTDKPETPDPSNQAVLVRHLSSLNIQPQTPSVTTYGEPPFDIESEYESPIEPPDELEDNDFPWDSDLDDPYDSGSDASADTNRRNEIFGNDPWNAVVVLGVRVYSKSVVKVRVVKAEEDES